MNEMKIPEGAENGLLLDFPREHKPEKSMKSELNEGNSDLQQLEEALRQSMMLSREVSEARRNVPACSYIVHCFENLAFRVFSVSFQVS